MKIVELKDERLLTTKQLAEMCGVTSGKVNMKLSKHRGSFQDSDYRLLTGLELNQIKVQLQEASKAGSMKVWTLQGASKMAKLLGNDKAQTTLKMYYERLFPFSSSKVQQDNEGRNNLVDVVVAAIQAVKQDSDQALIDELKERIKLLERIVEDKDSQNNQYMRIIQQLLPKQ